MRYSFTMAGSTTKTTVLTYMRRSSDLKALDSAEDLLAVRAPETMLPVTVSGHGYSPRLSDVSATAENARRARDLIQVTRKAPSCEGCVCYRELTVAEQVGRYYPRYRSVTKRMCAHPAYSHAEIDYTRGKLDFIPEFTCEESRAEGTVCGPEGRLFVRESRSGRLSWGLSWASGDLFWGVFVWTMIIWAVVKIIL